MWQPLVLRTFTFTYSSLPVLLTTHSCSVKVVGTATRLLSASRCSTEPTYSLTPRASDWLCDSTPILITEPTFTDGMTKYSLSAPPSHRYEPP